MESYFGVFTFVTGILVLFALGMRNEKTGFTKLLNFITTDCLVVWVIWAIVLFSSGS